MEKRRAERKRPRYNLTLATLTRAVYAKHSSERQHWQPVCMLRWLAIAKTDRDRES